VTGIIQAASEHPLSGNLKIKRYRDRAITCEQQAHRATDPALRASFLNAAKAWYQIADEIVNETERHRSAEPAATKKYRAGERS
jgi:hypothetical protein